MTLVELLVVVVILTTLVAAAIPVMAPSSETRRLREAARSLQTAITTAQTQATELGRPYGIWLEKASVQTGRVEDRGAVLTVYYCQEPLPFSGFSSGSSVILRPRTSNSYVVGATSDANDPSRRVLARFIQPTVGAFDQVPLPPFTIRPGDRLVVGNATFEFLHPDVSANEWDPNDPSNQFLKSTVVYELAYAGVSIPLYPGYLGSPWTYPQKYTIHRQPQKVGDPLQFPAGTAIDLEASGERLSFYHDPTRTGSFGDPVTNDNPVAILFSPGGGVHSVIRNAGGDGSTSQLIPEVVSGPPDGTIYLMVARRELVGESGVDPTQTSWLDPESLWVSVAPQTGRVSAEVNAATGEDLSLSATGTWDWDEFAQQRVNAREIARRGQNIGGR